MLCKKITVLAMCLVLLQTVFSWDDHDQLTQYVLLGEQWAEDLVIAESLESFLSKEKIQLVDVLQYLEKDADQNLPYYSPLPETLAFNPVLTGDALVKSFFAALRINPSYTFLLFYQPHAYEKRPEGKENIDTAVIDVFKNRFPNSPFIGIAEGEAIMVRDVIASASDEPDYGMDLGLFEDNKTPYGAQYGFGIQPWGNPALIYGSQAPVHMAFPWEDPIIKLVASWTQQSLSAYRILQFTALARLAFQTGHPYWGYRFAGIALHYLQDLAQPYHAKLFPGKSTLALLTMNMFASQKQKDDAVVLLSNRHLAFEDYVYDIIADRRDTELHTRMVQALSKQIPVIEYRNLYCYDVIAFQAYKAGNKLDNLIVSVFPAQIVNDPAYDYGADPERSWKALYDLAQKGQGVTGLNNFIETQLTQVGMYTRAYLDFVRLLKPIQQRNARADFISYMYIIAILLGVGCIVLLLMRPVYKRKKHQV